MKVYQSIFFDHTYYCGPDFNEACNALVKRDEQDNPHGVVQCWEDGKIIESWYHSSIDGWVRTETVIK